MTNYNERLDEIIRAVYNYGYVDGDPDAMRDKPNQMKQPEAKQAITSLIKELVAEAKPELPALFAELDDISVIMYKKAIDEFEQNLLKALEEL